MYSNRGCDVQSAKQKRRRCGGAKYRQYMHEQCANGFMSANKRWAVFTANGAADERLRLQEEGRIATQRHRDVDEGAYDPANQLVVYQNTHRLRYFRIIDVLTDKKRKCRRCGPASRS